LDILEDLLKKKYSVIIMHLFLDKKWIKKLNVYKPKKILLDVDYKILIKRNQKRVKEMKLTVNKTEANIWLENLYKKYTISLKNINQKEYIKLDGNNSIEDITKELIKIIFT
ncbi:MAG: hypothetical protein V1824_01975, partial [archaeon]